MVTHLPPASEVSGSNPEPFCGKDGSLLLMVASL